MPNDVVTTTDLCKSFGKTEALSGLSVTIEGHSITGLVGRNGSGKTTLMKIIAGILNKTSGEVTVFGGQSTDCLPILSRLVYTYHNVAYEPELSLKMILSAYKTMFKSFDSDFANKLMRYFELGPKTKYRNLSQGMASIFNFLCALSCRVELTMLDEPVLGMDVTVRKAVYDILLRDFSEYPRTFIVSSQFLSEIEGVLSSLLLIEQGKAVLHSNIDDVRHSAYRIDGSRAAVESFVLGKRVIVKKDSYFSSFAVVYEPFAKETAESAIERGLSVSSVRAEDLCVYLTRPDKEGELECLW